MNTDDLKDFFSDYDPSYILYDYRHWCGYSDTAYVFIFEKDNSLYMLEGGSSGEGSWHTRFEQIEKISLDEVCEILTEWDSVFGPLD